MISRRLARGTIYLLLLLVLVFLTTVEGDTPQGYFPKGDEYHPDDGGVVYRVYDYSTVKWYDPQGNQAHWCPYGGCGNLICTYEAGWQECYFYIKGQHRELGQYRVEAGSNIDYFEIIPYYAYLPLVQR